MLFIWTILIHASCCFKLTFYYMRLLICIFFFKYTYSTWGQQPSVFRFILVIAFILNQFSPCIHIKIGHQQKSSKFISFKCIFHLLISIFFSHLHCIVCSTLFIMESSRFSALINLNLQLFMCLLTLCARGHMPTLNLNQQNKIIIKWKKKN